MEDTTQEHLSHQIKVVLDLASPIEFCVPSRRVASTIQTQYKTENSQQEHVNVELRG